MMDAKAVEALAERVAARVCETLRRDLLAELREGLRAAGAGSSGRPARVPAPVPAGLLTVADLMKRWGLTQGGVYGRLANVPHSSRRVPSPRRHGRSVEVVTVEEADRIAKVAEQRKAERAAQATAARAAKGRGAPAATPRKAPAQPAPGQPWRLVNGRSMTVDEIAKRTGHTAATIGRAVRSGRLVLDSEDESVEARYTRESVRDLVRYMGGPGPGERPRGPVDEDEGE